MTCGGAPNRSRAEAGAQNVNACFLQNRGDRFQFRSVFRNYQNCFLRFFCAHDLTLYRKFVSGYGVTG